MVMVDPRSYRKLQGLFLILIILICQSVRTMQRKAIVSANYVPRGNEYRIGNLTVYESPNRVPKRVLIALHDISGMALSINLKQIADLFSEIYDFRVVLPNFFRVGPGNLPPTDPEALQDFIATRGSWDNVVKHDIKAIINWFKVRDYITEVGIYGMCWGGKVSMLAASQIDEIKVAGLIHPSAMNTSDAYGVRAPMYLMPASDDQDLFPFFQILKRRFGDNCGHKRFEDVLHGFAGSSVNFSDPLIARRVEEVITILGEFFSKNLNHWY